MGFFTRKQRPADSFEHFINGIAKTLPEPNSEEEVYTNDVGEQIITYYHPFEEPHFYFFDSVIIKTFEIKPANRNFIFESKKPLEIKKLKQLVNDFAKIYGNDDIGGGEFTKTDERDIKDKFWTGRNWLDSRHKHPVMISWYEDEGVGLTIFYTGE